MELDTIIESTLILSMKEVQRLVKEKFNVKYSLKQIGVITKNYYGIIVKHALFSLKHLKCRKTIKKTLIR